MFEILFIEFNVLSVKFKAVKFFNSTENTTISLAEPLCLRATPIQRANDDMKLP